MEEIVKKECREVESAERSVGGGCGEMESAVCVRREECNEDRHWEGKSATRIDIGKGRVQRG